MYLTAQYMLITYTRIIHMTKSGFILHLKLSKANQKIDQISLISACFFTCLSRIKVQKSCLKQRKQHCLSEISRTTKVTFFSALSSSLNYIWQIIYFGFCYKLPNFLTIIDGYCIWLSSDLTVRYNLKSLKHLLSVYT